jgi:hypothetical protein
MARLIRRCWWATQRVAGGRVTGAPMLTFAVKNGVDVFGLNELDKLNEAEGVACDCACFLKSLAALDVAAHALAAELNVVEPVVQDFIDAANEEG